ncbi:MAG: aminopeptidase N [Sphingosinicella sp.]
MPDMRPATGPRPPVIRREDYRPPDWLIPAIRLEFELDAERTLVRSILSAERAGSHKRPLRLNAEGLTIESAKIDGKPVEAQVEDGWLTLAPQQASAKVEICCAISPKANTQLMGLYESGGILCTQCEAEGFRRISPFVDRPDNLGRFQVRMTARKNLYPVLLCNGDRVGAGETGDGRHWAEWHDPFPKPCYLFALVAGDLAARRETFVTRSGREVELAIWVHRDELPKTAHAMASLKAAMRWDEETFGREYDLGMFNIVAVPDFNFGAMENKSLNIFNSRYILADPDTATDADFDAIAGVVAHEYFHNWSGNRVTCRDWFQLSLKEGFTVFRDQQFSADMGSAAVKRIEDVRMLRAAQFPEDSGPLAHPVRPDSYIEISNFYTATVYNKGAELIRMMHSLLGEEKFRAGCDLYFERHDGQAVTCDDFVRAMEDASGVDLERFRLWYAQAGTPKVTARLEHRRGEAWLHLEQQVPATPGQPDKAPMPIPLGVALIDPAGGRSSDERLVVLDEAKAEIRLGPASQSALLSINRNFSAPIIVESDRGAADLALLSAHDDDPFARYEAMQQLMLDTLIAAIADHRLVAEPVIEAVERTLADPALDAAFVAEAVLLPGETFIGDQMAQVDPEAIHRQREDLRKALGRKLERQWRHAYASHAANRYEYNPAAKGARRLRTIALAYLLAADLADAPELAFGQYRGADNMTDRQGALGLLANSDALQREDALADFYDRYRANPLVIDKWFSVQALSARGDTPASVEALARHPDFTLANPNRLRALVGAFSQNQRAFHDASGRGYRFVTDTILAVDKLNPQIAARLVPPLGRWRRFDDRRAAKMRDELERIAGTAGLSKDVYEQASKSLG